MKTAKRLPQKHDAGNARIFFTTNSYDMMNDNIVKSYVVAAGYTNKYYILHKQLNRVIVFF